MRAGSLPQVSLGSGAFQGGCPRVSEQNGGGTGRGPHARGRGRRPQVVHSAAPHSAKTRGRGNAVAPGAVHRVKSSVTSAGQEEGTREAERTT